MSDLSLARNYQQINHMLPHVAYTVTYVVCCTGVDPGMHWNGPTPTIGKDVLDRWV
jgi:hypothetical protein